MSSNPIPLKNEEYLYRRIPQIWFSNPPKPSPEAFKPQRGNDDNGLSFDRACRISLRDASKPKTKKARPGLRFVAKLRVGELKAMGLDLVIAKNRDSHILAVNFTPEMDQRRSEFWQNKLATELCAVFCPVSEKEIPDPSCAACNDTRCKLQKSA
jgi:hypothetical protein